MEEEVHQEGDHQAEVRLAEEAVHQEEDLVLGVASRRTSWATWEWEECPQAVDPQAVDPQEEDLMEERQLRRLHRAKPLEGRSSGKSTTRYP